MPRPGGTRRSNRTILADASVSYQIGRASCGGAPGRTLAGVWLGVLSIAVTTATGAAVIWLLLHARGLAGAARRGLQRAGVVEPDPPRPAGPPVERLAGDVLRIRRDLARLPRGCPVARRRGLVAAYDDALADSCRALGLPQRLAELPAGPERDAERTRVEVALADSGLVPRPGPGHRPGHGPGRTHRRR